MVRLFMMAATAAIALSAATAYAQSGLMPSLADVARQTAAQRANGKKATKVYTNSSLSEIPEDVVLTTGAATVTPPAAATTASAQTPVAAPAAAGNNDKAAKDSVAGDEKDWRAQAVTRRADLDRAKAALEKQQGGTPQHDQARRMVTYYQNRWDAFVASAKAANVPPAWLETQR